VGGKELGEKQWNHCEKFSKAYLINSKVVVKEINSFLLLV
jgi:hypothetical protein